jgi:hypothetical protein
MDSSLGTCGVYVPDGKRVDFEDYEINTQPCYETVFTYASKNGIIDEKMLEKIRSSPDRWDKPEYVPMLLRTLTLVFARSYTKLFVFASVPEKWLSSYDKTNPRRYVDIFVIAYKQLELCRRRMRYHDPMYELVVAPGTLGAFAMIELLGGSLSETAAFCYRFFHKPYTQEGVKIVYAPDKVIEDMKAKDSREYLKCQFEFVMSSRAKRRKLTCDQLDNMISILETCYEPDDTLDDICNADNPYPSSSDEE